jgi:hypothetical protein
MYFNMHQPFFFSIPNLKSNTYGTVVSNINNHKTIPTFAFLFTTSNFIHAVHLLDESKIK